MRALRTHAVGGPETLTLDEIDMPTPGRGEVLVAVRACAINFPDTLMIRDLYQFKPARPYAPGGEIAGVVETIGEDVTRWKPGDRVIAMTGHGGLSEKLVVAQDRAFAMPDEIGWQTAASLLMTYGTSIHALKQRGRVKAGDTVLVLGAAGGVGLSAVELAKAYGARTIAAVSTEEKADAAREAGADDVVIYPQAPFSKEASKALAESFKVACGPHGADIVFDIVGGDYSEPALRAIAWEGRFLVIGFPAGIAKLPLNLTLLKSCDVAGVFWGAFAKREPETNAANIAELFDLLAQGRIVPRISATYPLERGGEAIAALADRRAIGKLVVTMD